MPERDANGSSCAAGSEGSSAESSGSTSVTRRSRSATGRSSRSRRLSGHDGVRRGRTTSATPSMTSSWELVELTDAGDGRVVDVALEPDWRRSTHLRVGESLGHRRDLPPLPSRRRDLHQPVQERHPHRGRRDDLPDHGVPARQARQGRRVRAHEAAPGRGRQRRRQDLPRRREVPPGAHRDQADAVPLRLRRRGGVHGHRVLRADSSCPRDAIADEMRWVLPNDTVELLLVDERPTGRAGRERGRHGRHPDRSRASRATPPRAAAPSRRRSSRASSSRSRCSSTRATASASTPAAASTSPARRP